MSYTRTDAITEIRDNLYEASADLWTDAQLIKHLRAEIRGLPRKRIFLEEIWSVPTEENRRDYSLPTGTFKIELLEKNIGTSDIEDYQEMKGWDMYANTLWLPYRPGHIFTMRAHLQKGFTDPSSDITLDVPDDKMEVVIWGTCVRAYRQLIGYLLDAKNWDSIAKPDGISLNQVVTWLRDARAEYKELLNTYKSVPRPRDINLVG